MTLLSYFKRIDVSPRSALSLAAWPALVFVLALIPRLVNLGGRSFWLDEILTFNRASLAPSALALNSFQNHHMPGFFLLLAPLTHMPHPEYWLRLPSAIFGALSVALVFMIASRIAGRLSGVLAALFLCLSPAALGFAQEARSYTLVMTLILIALYGVTRLAQDWQHERTGWGCYIVGTALALAVLGDSLPWFIAANLIFACLGAFVPQPKRFALQVLKADTLILLVTVPLYTIMLHFQTQGVATSLEWIPGLSLSQVWYSFGSVYLMRVPDWVSFKLLVHHAVPGVIWLIDLLMLLALVAAVWRLRRQPEMLIILGISFLFLPCLFLVISIVHPILLPRYLLWSAAPLAVLVGVGMETLLKHLPLAHHKLFNIRKLAAVAVLVLLVLNVVPYYRDELKPDWNAAAQRLAEDVKPGDMVLFSDTGAVPILKFYLSDAQNTSVLSSPYSSVNDAVRALKNGKRVWVVYGHAGQNTTTHTTFFAQLETLGTPDLIQKAGKRIYIARYDPSIRLASGE